MIEKIVKLIKAIAMKHRERNEEPDEVPKYLITHLEKEILMKLSDILQQNESIKSQLNKAEVEIVKRVADLQAAIDKLTQQLADVELTPEQAASFDELKVAAQALDDINPDDVPPAA
jgi:hypothetical protein